jgi:hypothetical protein
MLQPGATGREEEEEVFIRAPSLVISVSETNPVHAFRPCFDVKTSVLVQVPTKLEM